MAFSQMGKFKFPIACGDFGVVQIAFPFSKKPPINDKSHQRAPKIGKIGHLLVY